VVLVDLVDLAVQLHLRLGLSNIEYHQHPMLKFVRWHQEHPNWVQHPVVLATRSDPVQLRPAELFVHGLITV
jgi:hypothetical protein